MFSLRIIFISAATCALACAARADEAGAASPFLPAGTAAASEADSGARYELVGIIATSKHAMVGLTDKTSHHSFWITPDKALEGVELISCDPQNDRATIRVDGVVQTLQMHAAGATSTAQAPTATPVATAAPLPAPVPVNSAAQAQQEQDARMLVSDLLEIGIAQRKAYEAQKAAANPPAAK